MTNAVGTITAGLNSTTFDFPTETTADWTWSSATVGPVYMPATTAAGTEIPGWVETVTVQLVG
jgi:hypothetical protein